MVNKIVGMALQVAGGLLVLFSVNENLGLFRKQSFRSAIVAWMKSFPIVRRPVTLSVSGIASATSMGAMAVTVNRQVSTLDERVAELERQLKSLQEKLMRELEAVQGRLEVVRGELQQRIAETSDRVADLSKRLEHAAVGGFKLQALGVLLAIYGAITSVFA